MDVRVRWEIIKLTSTIIIWRIIRPIGNDLRGSQQSANYLATDTHSAFTICPERTVRTEQSTTLWKQSADNGLGTLLVPVGCAPISAYYLQLHWEALYLFILARQLLASSSASISIVWKYKFIPCFAILLLVDDAIGNWDEEVDLVTSSNKRLLNGGCCGWSPEAAGTIIWQQKPFVYWLINFSIGRFFLYGSVCTNTRTNGI